LNTYKNFLKKKIYNSMDGSLKISLFLFCCH
jgi:hypothetical protein